MLLRTGCLYNGVLRAGAVRGAELPHPLTNAPTHPASPTYHVAYTNFILHFILNNVSYMTAKYSLFLGGGNDKYLKQ